jgi:hypothetical protein
VKARKIKSFGNKPRERLSESFPKARLILKEIVEENLETFKILARYWVSAFISPPFVKFCAFG